MKAPGLVSVSTLEALNVISWFQKFAVSNLHLYGYSVGRGRDGLGAGVSASGGSAANASSAAAAKRNKNTGGVRRLPEMCHQFDLTREMDPKEADAAVGLCELNPVDS